MNKGLFLEKQLIFSSLFFCQQQLKNSDSGYKFTNHFPMCTHSLDKQMIDDVSSFQSGIHLEEGKSVCEFLSWGCQWYYFA